MIIHFSNSFVTILLILLCLLASLDLFQQYRSKYNEMIFYQYSMGMQTISDLWDIGYRAENLDLKLQYQQNSLKNLMESFSQSFSLASSSSPSTSSPSLSLRSHDSSHHHHHKNNFMNRKLLRNLLQNYHEYDLNRTVEIWCEEINQQVRIGSNDFRTDDRDTCLLYSGDHLTNVIQGPETMFELVDLGDQAFGLKSITNGKYVQVIPPGSRDSFDPWKVSLGGYIPGASERFRLSPEGYLFSGLMGQSALHPSCSSLPSLSLFLSLSPPPPIHSSPSLRRIPLLHRERSNLRK
jgi:hypothetical protein